MHNSVAGDTTCCCSSGRTKRNCNGLISEGGGGDKTVISNNAVAEKCRCHLLMHQFAHKFIYIHIYMYVYIHKMLLLVLTTVGQNTQDTRCNTNKTTIVSMLTYSRRRTAYVTTACTIYTYVWASRLLHPWTCTDVWWSARRQQKKKMGDLLSFIGMYDDFGCILTLRVEVVLVDPLQEQTHGLKTVRCVSTCSCGLQKQYRGGKIVYPIYR